MALLFCSPRFEIGGIGSVTKKIGVLYEDGVVLFDYDYEYVKEYQSLSTICLPTRGYKASVFTD